MENNIYSLIKERLDRCERNQYIRYVDMNLDLFNKLLEDCIDLKLPYEEGFMPFTDRSILAVGFYGKIKDTIIRVGPYNGIKLTIEDKINIK